MSVEVYLKLVPCIYEGKKSFFLSAAVIFLWFFWSFSAVNNSLRKNAEDRNYSSEPQAVGFSEQSSPFHHQAHGVSLSLGGVRDPSWQQKHLKFETKSSEMHSEEDSPEIKLIAQACCASLFLSAESDGNWSRKIVSRRV